MWLLLLPSADAITGLLLMMIIGWLAFKGINVIYHGYRIYCSMIDHPGMYSLAYVLPVHFYHFIILKPLGLVVSLWRVIVDSGLWPLLTVPVWPDCLRPLSFLCADLRRRRLETAHLSRQ